MTAAAMEFARIKLVFATKEPLVLTVVLRAVQERKEKKFAMEEENAIQLVEIAYVKMGIME